MAVKMGVVGLGSWGRLHCEVYNQHPEAELVALCDQSEDALDRAATEFPDSRTYSTATELVEDDEIDAVAVATPDFAHREVAVTAANAGKHLIVEKPLATTVEDAEAICGAVSSNGVRLMVDFHNRWNPLFVSVKETIAERKMGDISHIYIRHSNTQAVPKVRLPWSDKSSVAWFLGSHSMDLAAWIAEAAPHKVYCSSQKRFLDAEGIDTPDFFLSTVEFENGVVALVENSWMLPDSLPTAGDFKAEIVGSEGTAYVNHSTHRAVDVFHTQEELPDLFVEPSFAPETGFARKSIAHFVTCLENERDFAVDGNDGLVNTQIISAMLRSVKEGQPIHL